MNKEERQQYEIIRKEMNQLLVSMLSKIDLPSYKEVEANVNTYGELDLAFEFLCDRLNMTEVQISQEEYNQLEVIGNMLQEIPTSTWQILKPD